MKPEDYAKLPRHPDTGTAVIKIMTDPAAEDGAGVDRAFLSLVDRGANGRSFTVVKAAGSPDDPSPAIQPQADETLGGAPPWWRRMFAFLVGGETTAKADAAAPTDFDAAVAMPMLREKLWSLEDGLREVIRNILADEAITDKPGAIAVALDRFKAHVLHCVGEALAPTTMVPMTMVAKRAAAAMAGAEGTAWKAGPSHGGYRSAILAIDATVQQVQAKLAELPTLLNRLTAGKAGSPPTPANSEDDTMITAAMLTLIATAAGDSAVTAAKAAGVTDPAQLEQRRQAAAAVAIKVAVTGPGNPQPGIPEAELARQMAMAPFGGTGADMEAKITAAVQAAMGTVTAKLAEIEGKLGEVQVQLTGKGEGDARVPGIADVVNAQADALERVGKVVRKMAGTPAAPQAGRPGAQPVAKGAALEDDDDLFAGTALRFAHRAPEGQGRKPAAG